MCLLLMSRNKYVLILLCVVAFGFHSFSFAQECLEGSEDIVNLYLGKIAEYDAVQYGSISNLLVNKQDTSSERKWLILHFCDTVLGTRPGWPDENMKHACFTHDTFTYDPRQSLFMYSLCVNVEDKNNLGSKKEWKEKRFEVWDFAWKDYVEEGLDLNEIWWIPSQDKLDAEVARDACNPKTTMQACNFSTFLPNIFKEIMNVYSNMKLANLYSYKYLLNDESEADREKHITDAIKEFSESYFKPPARSPNSPSDNECGEEWVTYISKPDSKWDKKHCTHPSTYDMMESTILSAAKLIENIEWLKADEVMTNVCYPKDASQQLLWCAFSNKWTYFSDSDWKYYQNLYLNELLYFSLFSDYYANQILDNITYNVGNQAWYTASADRNKKEFKAVQQEIQLHTTATYQSMRLLSQIYVSYPLHVALTAYTEDLLKYRKEFVKLYTPLNQLYYLLRNVQACEG